MREWSKSGSFGSYPKNQNGANPSLATCNLHDHFMGDHKSLQGGCNHIALDQGSKFSHTEFSLVQYQMERLSNFGLLVKSGIMSGSNPEVKRSNRLRPATLSL